MLSAVRIWFGGVFPVWLATLIYLAMGWGSLFCYRELARTYSHRTLLPLPLGGIFYSVGAVINLAKWPVLSPGFFGSHELFHLFVIAGSACHVFFMMQVVIPAPWPGTRGVPVRSQPRPALLLRWARAMLSRRVRRWMLLLPHPQMARARPGRRPPRGPARPRGPPKSSDVASDRPDHRATPTAGHALVQALADPANRRDPDRRQPRRSTQPTEMPSRRDSARRLAHSYKLYLEDRRFPAYNNNCLHNRISMSTNQD